ncbi:MAG: ABC transporter ATP-binding protein [Alphaproteobacteria bacterium]|nr:ABC transporter ATP-binding protein [Alphaproteobacteria bacterium]
MVALSAHQLTKHFGTTLAVDAVDFTIPDGALATFLGPSGCGKTTTLRMVAGLERPSQGRITLGEEVVFDAAQGIAVPAEHRQIGMVFQSYAIWPHMTVAGNVAFPLGIRRLPRDEIDRRVRDVLALVQLDHLAERYPAQLSGGQQQRVALARAIVFQPRILLLDEPLSNLDAKLREEMRGEIRELQQRLGMTTLFVTHDQAEALAMSDLVAVMNAGKIVQVGPPRAIYERPVSRFVAEFVGWTNFLPVTLVDRTTARLGDRLMQVAADNLAPGAAATLTIRPEDVVVEAAGAGGPNLLPGKVRTSMFMGTHTIVELDAAGHELVAHAPAQTTANRGDDVGVRLPVERMLVLSP